MFYEEEFRDGIWMFRTTPNGEFRPMSLEMLNEKAAELTKRCAQAERLRDELSNAATSLETIWLKRGFSPGEVSPNVEGYARSRMRAAKASLAQWEAE